MEQELDEAIHEAKSIKRTYLNGCKSNKEKANDVQAREDALQAQKEALQVQMDKYAEMIQKAQIKQNTALQMQKKATQERDEAREDREQARQLLENVRTLPKFDTKNIYITQKSKDTGRFSQPMLYSDFKKKHEETQRRARALFAKSEEMENTGLDDWQKTY